jgi:hypothetical protein
MHQNDCSRKREKGEHLRYVDRQKLEGLVTANRLLPR